jgi:hypothetical protein
MVALDDLPIELEYDLTVEDHVEAALFHHQRSPSAQRTLRGLLIGCSAFIVGTSLLGGGSMLFPLALVGGFVVFMKAIVPRINRQQAEALFREGRNRGLVGRQRLVLSRLNMTAINEVQETKTRWLGVERIVMSEHLIHIYTNSVRALLVPRRAFPSEAACEQFLSIARQLHAAALPSGEQPVALPPA